MIDLLCTLFRLKDEERTGWVLRGIGDPESVSDHCWGTAIACLLFGPAAGVDVSRSVSMALVHDLAEAVTGDVAARTASGRVVPDPEKAKSEHRAFEVLSGLVADEESRSRFKQIRELWEEYAGGSSREALFVRDMNLIDMCLQAYLYESEQRTETGTNDPSRASGTASHGRGLAEFFETSKERLSTALGQELFAAIAKRYETLSG